MKILITGGAGFIGANFIYYQLKHHPEDEILCVDKLTYAGNMASLDRAMESPRLRFLQNGHLRPGSH
jgi:dTDP-glucose 4,6-dehydratase